MHPNDVLYQAPDGLGRPGAKGACLLQKHRLRDERMVRARIIEGSAARTAMWTTKGGEAEAEAEEE